MFTMSSKENAGPSRRYERKRETGSVTSCRSAVIRDITSLCSIQVAFRSNQHTQRNSFMLPRLRPHFYLILFFFRSVSVCARPISNHRPFTSFSRIFARREFQATETCHLPNKSLASVILFYCARDIAPSKAVSFNDNNKCK